PYSPPEKPPAIRRGTGRSTRQQQQHHSVAAAGARQPSVHAQGKSIYLPANPFAENNRLGSCRRRPFSTKCKRARRVCSPKMLRACLRGGRNVGGLTGAWTLAIASASATTLAL
ncbi:unnamed protein product, partial [Ectocarpus sp. 6 AP-2014]